MDKSSMGKFCKKLKKIHGAAECRSFSGRVECYAAIFDAIELGPNDCVYVSPLTPGSIVRLILAYRAIPVFCDIAADSFLMDHRSLENAVRQTISADRLYPRAVIASYVCGMPFAFRAVNGICDRMGLILIEDCGNGYGGTWDGTLSGSAGDYAVISLGRSSVFGTGGSGCLLLCREDFELSRNLKFCDGEGYDTADAMYADALLAALDGIPAVLERTREAFAAVTEAMKDSDFWLQRGSGRHRSSCVGTVVIAQDEAQCQAAVAALEAAGLSDFVKRMHSHHKACFEHGCRGFKFLDNANALAPRAFTLDLMGALNAGQFDVLLSKLKEL